MVIQDVNRLTRNYYDGVALEKFVIENDKIIMSLSEPVDLTTPYGRFMFRVKLAMNSFYIENLVEKMLTFAIGRGLEYYDRCVVDEIALTLGEHDHRLHTLISEIVLSEPFPKRTLLNNE